MRIGKKSWHAFKLAVFVLCLTPFIVLCVDTWQDNLGANPIETLHFTLGDWALNFLCFTLFLSPYKQITGQNWVNRFRRMFGLFTFFYASMHLLVFLILDLSLSWEAFTDEVRESPYILLGLATFGLLLPLALTSTRNSQKRLGKYWKKIHRLIYIASISAILHYISLVKSDLTVPLVYTNIIIVLLLYRLANYMKKQRVASNY